METARISTSKGSRKSPTEEPSICSCVNARRASRAITRIYDQTMEPAAMKVTQYSVLVNVARSGPVTASGLARMLRLDRTTLVRNLKALEAAGFLEEAASPDPRERGIAITKAGLLAVERAKPYWILAQQRIEAHLGEDGAKQLGLLAVALERLSDGCGGEL